MKKLFIVILFVSFIFLGVCGCKKEKNYGLEFKNEYESLNGVVNKNGKEHRTISIKENNPYIKTTPEEIVKKIEKKETFYLYVGDPLCPWCRSVLEKSIEVAEKNGVKEIYYIEIWDDDGSEILRDKYEIVNDKVTKTLEGTESYKKLLNYFDSVLKEYTIMDPNGNRVSTGEKRIYAPNYFYVVDGKVKKMVSGTSDKQTDSRGELTKEILEDEENIFNEFFLQACSIDGC